MTGIDEMLRRLFDYNQQYEAKRRRRHPALSEDQVALACANAVAQAMREGIGFGWSHGPTFRNGQLEERRRTASGQSLVVGCSAKGDTVVFDFGIASGTRPSPGSAFPRRGSWSGVFRDDTIRDFSAAFVDSFHDHGRHRVNLVEALEYLRIFFQDNFDVNKPLQVNYDERQLPSGLKSQTAKKAAMMLEDLLEQCGQRGSFLLRAREQKTMRCNTRIRVGTVVGSSIRVTVRPGDGGTCWVYDLACPGTVDAKTLAEKLVVALGQREDDETESVPAPEHATSDARLANPSQNGAMQNGATQNGAMQNGATQNGATDTADVLKLLAGAIERKRDREQRLATLEKLRQDLVQELETVQGRIKDVERRQEALMAEEEGDAQGRAVDDVLQALSRVFVKPT